MSQSCSNLNLRKKQLNLFRIGCNLHSCMESSTDYCYRWENGLNEIEGASNDSINVREAGEVILFVRGCPKAAKYAQTLWYLEHIGSTVAVESTSKVSSSVVCGKSRFHLEAAEII